MKQCPEECGCIFAAIRWVVIFLLTLALFGLLTFVFPLRPAHAHTQWANGEPVPDWVSRACCGKNDVHHLRAEQVHQMSDGFHVDGYPYVIPYSKALPSPDGEYWGFWAEYSAGSFSKPYCFFAGAQGS